MGSNQLIDYNTHSCLDKPWMTTFIKRELKARQKAFSGRKVVRCKELCDKIARLIKKAKEVYYNSKVGQRKYNPNITTEQTTKTAEILQDIFKKPWQDLPASSIPSLAEVAPLLKDNPIPVPSIGQVKMTQNILNQEKLLDQRRSQRGF